jgi:hypothetical protein
MPLRINADLTSDKQHVAAPHTLTEKICIRAIAV